MYVANSMLVSLIYSLILAPTLNSLLYQLGSIILNLIYVFFIVLLALAVIFLILWPLILNLFVLDLSPILFS